MKNKTKPVCKIEDCTLPVHGRGYCNTHYAAWRRSDEGKNTPKPFRRLKAEHGTSSMYSNHGCRCIPCSAAWKAFQRKRINDNPEYYQALWKQYRESHADKIADYKWYKKNKKTVVDRAIKWNREHPSSRQQHRALTLNAPGKASDAQIRARIEYFGGLCWMCSSVADTIDHVIPLSKNGSNWASNLRPACRSCNSKKGNRVINYSLNCQMSKEMG